MQKALEVVDGGSMTDPHRSLLIRGGRIVDPANAFDDVADLLIEEGKVTGIGRSLSAPGAPVLDASGLLVAPGFIDSHVHLREPGFEHKEDIASATSAAAAGGICAVVAMPNTEPPPDSAGALEEFYQRAAGAVTRVYTVGCVTRGRAGVELAPLAELASCGAVAFSDDGDPVESADLMMGALKLARAAGRPVFPHEEVREITAGGCMHEGAVSARLGVRGMPAAGEEEMIARDIELVRQTGAALHIAHISTAGAVDLVRQAKTAGLPVSCEVLTHHFVLADEAVAIHGSAAKMSPPLRAPSDVEAMLAGLADATIDTIATDHAPHTAQEKALPLAEAPFGIVGLETGIGLTFTYLVEPRVLDLPAAVARWTWEPARLLGLPGGRLSPGDPGDVTVIDMESKWRVDPGEFRSKSTNTPFAGYELRGRAVATVVGGRVVYRTDA